MDKEAFSSFEHIVRRAHLSSDEEVRIDAVTHPFEERNIHALLPSLVRKLFDDGYFAQATFEAFKYLDKEVAKFAKSKKSGFKLMMEAFSEISPLVQLTPLSDQSEIDEQHGYKFIFAGSVMAIRNPRGHEHSVRDTMENCLDHLSLVSLLLRRLEQSGFRVGA